ncbi:11484_t:CDS:2, partial [Scutellospora calospora]
MFLGGLKPRTASWLSIGELANLEDAIAVARKIEAGEYYDERNGKEIEPPIIPRQDPGQIIEIITLIIMEEEAEIIIMVHYITAIDMGNLDISRATSPPGPNSRPRQPGHPNFAKAKGLVAPTPTLENGNPLLIEIDLVVSPPKPRRKANVTLGQMLQYPDQRKKLVNALKRLFPPTPSIPMIVQVPEEMETN